MEEHIAEVEILGHKAKVSHIRGQLAGSLWLKKEDTLSVWLSFDEAVEGTLSFPIDFPIDLPAKAYSRTEFLDLVVKKGETALRGFSASNAQQRAEMEAREERQAALDHLAQLVEAEVTK